MIPELCVWCFNDEEAEDYADMILESILARYQLDHFYDDVT